MKNKPFLVLLASLLCLMFAPHVTAANLLEIYRTALLNDPVYQSARANYMAATEAYPQARAALLPNMNFAASVTAYNIDTMSASAFSLKPGDFQFTGRVYTLTLNQPIFNFASWSQLHVAGYQVRQAAALFASAAQDLIIRVAKAYFAVLQAEDTLGFIQAQKKATYQQLDQAKQRYDVGLETVTAVYDAQASYDSIDAQEIAARNEVLNTKEELRRITGVFYMNVAKLKKNLPLLNPQPNNVQRWVLNAEEFNFPLLATRFASQAAHETIKVNFAGHLPTINGSVAYNRQEGNILSLFPNATTTSAGVALNLPIYQGGLVDSQVRQAQDLYQKSIADMHATRRQVVTSTHQTFNDVVSGVSKIKADQRAIVSKLSSLESTEASLKAGTRTMVDLLLAQQSLYDNKRILAFDQYRYINDLLKLKQLSGSLCGKDVQEINQWLV